MKNFIKFSVIALCAAIGLASCDKTEKESANLIISADKYIIKADGQEAVTLKVTCNGDDVTADCEFFEGTTLLEGPVYKTSKTGLHLIWAEYQTKITEDCMINAIDFDVPGAPADAEPNNLKFKHKVAWSQWTGHKCGFCANLYFNIKEPILDNPEMMDKLQMVMFHGYSEDDPAYYTADMFLNYYGSVGAPTVVLNFEKFMNGFSPAQYPNEFIVSGVNKAYNDQADVCPGISVKSDRSGNIIVARVTVKAAVTKEYTVGAYLLEDGIIATQTGATARPWMNTHNNCVREVYPKVNNQTSRKWFGYNLGTIEKGQTKDYVIVIDLAQAWADNWRFSFGDKTPLAGHDYKDENLHIAYFVNSFNGRVVSGENIINAPLVGEVPFQYEK